MELVIVFYINFVSKVIDACPFYQDKTSTINNKTAETLLVKDRPMNALF